MIKGAILGVLAGVVGAAVWAGIAYTTNYEIGWIAWGIGLLVGFAVMVGVGEHAGVPSGVLALVITCLSIVGGKYAVVEYVVSHETGTFIEQELAKFASDEYTISFIADQVVYEWQEAEKAINWPRGSAPENPERQADYPAAIWREADSRWAAMEPKEREAFREAMRANLQVQLEQLVGTYHDKAAAEGFAASFTLFDLLFFGLGAVTAFKIGSGAGREAA